MFTSKSVMTRSEIKAFFKAMRPYLAPSTLDELSDCCDYLKLPKGTALIQEGKRHHYCYFITKGAVKSYYLNDGKEICSWFAFERETVSTIKTFAGQPSNETIKLIEDSAFIRVNIKAFKALAESNISIGRLTHELLIEHAIFLEELLYLKSKPGKERYQELINAEPQLLQRVSLTDLASFLGISRETLSRIRSKS